MDIVIVRAMALSATSNGLISPKQIAHFGIRTTPDKFESMVQWHLNFFGAEAVMKGEHFAFIRWDDEHHRMVILSDPTNQHAVDRRLQTGIYHIAFSLPTLKELADSYQQKAERGILPTWPVNHGMSTSMYYFDPDGNEFEMQVDNFDTAEEAHAFMRTEEYQMNPLGADILVPDWIARVRSGEDEKKIKARPVIGPRRARWQNSIYFEKDPTSDSVHAVRRLEVPGVAPVS